jgi:tetratricopeptide (TPR) repeat protein
MMRFLRSELNRWSLRNAAATAALTVVATALGSSEALAQRGRSEVKEGNRLYSEGRYDEAHEKYLEALRAAPNSPLIRFNDGNALYQSQEFQRALEAYREAIESGDAALESKAWYNLGNAFYRHQKLPEALDAYKQALRSDPTDEDAKHNLELLLQQLEQQQQPQEQQDQGEGEDESAGEDEAQPQTQPEEEGSEEQGDKGQEQQQEREQQQEQQPQPQPGEMSREEAERLLQAIKEDPEKIARQRVRAGRRKLKKDW